MSCNPNTLISNGKDFQKLSEREQQVAIAQLLCDISGGGGSIGAPFLTVSAKGIANGLSTIANDGMAYGPDTSGTTTSGIQEAISALPTGDLTSRFAGGGFILLGKGVFSCSGQITIPNAGAFNLRMEGCGKVGSVLKYTGIAASFINTSVDSVSAPGASSLNCTFRSIGFTHGDPSTSATILMRLFALNEADIDDCLFCPDAALASAGNCLNYTPTGSAVGTEAIRTSGCNMVRIRNSAFWRCARGVGILNAVGGASPHGRIDNTIFDGCSDANSNYSFSNDGTYSYPKSYGAMIAAGDLILHGCQFDGCTMPTVSGNFVENHMPVFESCTYKSVANSDLGGFTRIFDPNPAMDSGYTLVDKQQDVAGTVTTATSAQAQTFYSFGTDDEGWRWIVGGETRWLFEKTGRVTSSDATRTQQTLADIAGLTISNLEATGVYEFEAVLSVATSADAFGTKYAVQFSAAGAAVEAQAIGSLSAAVAQSERISALNTAGLTYLTGVSETGQVLIKGILTVGANAGHLTIQHLKVTSGTSTVKVNSFLKARRIA